MDEGDFNFSLNKLREYVQCCNIDGIAITNHNTFDSAQFSDIRNALEDICEVLPGIEVNVGRSSVGHLICIAELNDIDDFALRCQDVQQKITDPKSFLTVDDLQAIFPDMQKYLWIPHYEKKPNVDKSILTALKEYILCGEVGSVKKFIYCQKDSAALTPVYFSDLRPTDSLKEFKPRQTYFDIVEITVGAIKRTLTNRNHVSLTEAEGNSLFYALPDLRLSTGLNVMIGERSSGKTYSLNQIAEHNQNVKYIRQFELIEPDPEKAAKEFTERISEKKRGFAVDYFEPFQDAIEDVKNISLVDDEKAIESYLSALIRFAEEQDRADMFAKCALYNETQFPTRSLENIQTIIDAVEKLLDAVEYRDLINQYIERDALIALHEKLIEKYYQERRKSLEEAWVNSLVEEVKRSLRTKSASTNIPDVDFYACQMNRKKVETFNVLAGFVKEDQIIDRQEIEGFTVQTTKRPFGSAAELKKHCGKSKTAFSELMDDYQCNPYQYLLGLTEKEYIPETEYYSYFAYVDYQILNRYGAQISGGERAEFKLLQSINDAYRYDMLLIDEPESSFDNLFLKERVNHIIREIAGTMPVVLVTHNNTVGASIKPDYLVYTKRNIVDGQAQYERYSGHPSSKELRSVTGKQIKNIQALMDCLEAGEDSYNERKHDYDLLKN